jgi:hypothetical protein
MISYIDDKASGSARETKVGTATVGASYTIDALRFVGGYLDVNDKRAQDLDGHGWWIGDGLPDRRQPAEVPVPAEQGRDRQRQQAPTPTAWATSTTSPSAPRSTPR